MTAELRERLQQSLGSAYTIERELGGGGMSRVFVAEETRFRRRVVIKVLSPELAAAISVQRFEREITLAAQMQQANIVSVITAGEVDGLPFFTMPYVEGESLRARLTGGPLSIGETVSVLRDVARALAYAHERGIVHRDIKPDNVLLSGAAAVVTDFGIAKALADAAGERTSPDATNLTQMGASIGTPTYMAPEQAAGDPDVDHRADIYAFGCMAYELLAGAPPFTARTPQRVLAAHMSEAPRNVLVVRADTPAALAAVVMRCLAKDPADRPQSAPELLRSLETVGTGVSTAMSPVLLGQTGMLKRALLAYAGAFVLVALVTRAAIIALGLPDWVFPGALIVMALGLPVILFTAYSHHVAHRLAVQT
ncbi:MAG: protein kinase, partial [Gemmatimonadetes bacterium]|nr:protein kinase [Gemmatimonadota bacterium]